MKKVNPLWESAAWGVLLVSSPTSSSLTSSMSSTSIVAPFSNQRDFWESYFAIKQTCMGYWVGSWYDQDAWEHIVHHGLLCCKHFPATMNPLDSVTVHAFIIVLVHVYGDITTLVKTVWSTNKMCSLVCQQSVEHEWRVRRDDGRKQWHVENYTTTAVFAVHKLITSCSTDPSWPFLVLTLHQLQHTPVRLSHARLRAGQTFSSLMRFIQFAFALAARLLCSCRVFTTMEQHCKVTFGISLRGDIFQTTQHLAQHKLVCR